MSLPASELVKFVGLQNLIICNVLAASAFTFWDHCITFREEVDLIWRTKWTLVSVLFCIIRYLTLCIRIVEMIFYTDVLGLLHPSVAGCKAWMWFETTTGIILHIAVELLLMMRVFAFYGRNMRLLAILFFLFLCERVSTFFVAVVSLSRFDVRATLLPPNLPVGRCVVVKIDPLFVSFWIPGLIIESILFLLLIAMFLQTKRYTGMSTPRLLVVFVRDGAWAFAVIFAVLLWCALAFEFNVQKGDIALTWLYSALSFCGSRLILNLRSAAREHIWRTSEVRELDIMRTEFALSAHGVTQKPTGGESPEEGRESTSRLMT